MRDQGKIDLSPKLQGQFLTLKQNLELQQNFGKFVSPAPREEEEVGVNDRLIGAQLHKTE